MVQPWPLAVPIGPKSVPLRPIRLLHNDVTGARRREPFGLLDHFLETTELPVKTIAGKIGYRSRGNLSRAFKAKYGIDPNAYR